MNDWRIAVLVLVVGLSLLMLRFGIERALFLFIAIAENQQRGDEEPEVWNNFRERAADIAFTVAAGVVLLFFLPALAAGLE